MRTPKIGDQIHVALPSSYGAHAGICRIALVCEVLSEQHVSAHLFVAPSDLAGLPDTDSKTRVPYFQGFHSVQRLPDTWHYEDECTREE
jgi:hypothetical protein